MLSHGVPEQFAEPLVSETARLLAAAQMLLDLVVLGLGIQVLLGAVRRGREALRSVDSKCSPTIATTRRLLSMVHADWVMPVFAQMATVRW